MIRSLRRATTDDDTANQSGAFGRPGIEPRWTRSAKDAVGTAYSASSRVWFTLSAGILNEVYYPTIDRPQIRDLQFLMTGGESTKVAIPPVVETLAPAADLSSPEHQTSRRADL